MALWNQAKTTMLLAALMGLALGVGYLLGGPDALLPALLLGGLMNVLAYFFSDRIALATMRAQGVSRQQDPRLHDLVERLSARAGIPTPRIYVSPAAAPNAFATGRNPRHGVVCVTAGLREMLSEGELAGVIAHELGHIKNRDILISTLAAVMAGAISYLAYMAMWMGHGRSRRQGHPLAALLLVVVAPLAALLIRMAISRSREYAADAAGAEYTGTPGQLAGALTKLGYYSGRIPLPVPDAQSSLFIVAPLTGGSRELAHLFSTHPPIEERIRRLRQMEAAGR